MKRTIIEYRTKREYHRSHAGTNELRYTPLYRPDVLLSTLMNSTVKILHTKSTGRDKIKMDLFGKGAGCNGGRGAVMAESVCYERKGDGRERKRKERGRWQRRTKEGGLDNRRVKTKEGERDGQGRGGKGDGKGERREENKKKGRKKLKERVESRGGKEDRRKEEERDDRGGWKGRNCDSPK